MGLKNLGDDPARPLLHGVGVLYQSKGILIIGPSGSGKTSFALELMQAGGQLIADDRIYIEQQGTGLLMQRPEQIKNKIEVYGLGVLKCVSIENAPLALVVDMAAPPPKRMPDRKTVEILGLPVPCIAHTQNKGFISALSLYFSHGFAKDT